MSLSLRIGPTLGRMARKTGWSAWRRATLPKRLMPQCGKRSYARWVGVSQRQRAALSVLAQSLDFFRRESAGTPLSGKKYSARDQDAAPISRL